MEGECGGLGAGGYVRCTDALCFAPRWELCVVEGRCWLIVVLYFDVVGRMYLCTHLSGKSTRDEQVKYEHN